jgi:hypothetical protein
MTKETILQELIEALERLVTLLRLDPTCQWGKAFEENLELSKEMLAEGFSASDASKLSNSIRCVFQGTGSFNDYAPGKYNPSTGRYSPIPGTEDFEGIAEKVFNLANQLRER